jgi:uncharacterized repeat protein (TIGR01451 family)
VLTAILALVGASIVILPTASVAAPAVSTAEGRFLSGQVLGLNLDTIAQLAAADAQNTTGGAPVIVQHPLDVTALQAVNVDLGNGLNLLGAQHLLTLGAVNQFAQANGDGSSYGSSGLLTDNGAISTGTGSLGGDGSASLDLSQLIGSTLAATVAGLTLQTGALSASATKTSAADTGTGDYNIAGLQLAFTSPVIGALIGTLVSGINGLQPLVDLLPSVVNALPLHLLTIDGVPSLAQLTSTLTNISLDGGSITVNLTTGVITVDVAAMLAFLHLDINNQPVDADIIQLVLGQLTTLLPTALTGAINGIVSGVTSALNNITVHVLGSVDIKLSAVGGALDAVTAGLTPVVATALGGVQSAVDGIASVLPAILALNVNVQETTSTTFTERALRIGILNLVGGAATVNLASATVGPNSAPAPNLGLTMTGPFATGTTTPALSSLTAGQDADYQITIANTGTKATTGPNTVVEYLSPGLAYDSVASAPPGTTCVVDSSTSFTGTRLICTIPGPIATGASVVITVHTTVDATAGSSVTNTAATTVDGSSEPSDLPPADCAAAATCDSVGPTPVVAPPHPVFGQTLSTDQPSYQPGQPISYQVTVTNTGAIGGTANVALPLPVGVLGVTAGSISCAPSSAGTGACGPPSVDGTPAANVAVTVPAGQSVVVTVSGTVSGAAVTGDLATQGTVTPTDAVCSAVGVNCGGGPTNEVNPTVGPHPIFAGTLATDQPSYLPGQAITYTATIANSGAGDGTAAVTLPIPPGMSPVTAANVACAAAGGGTATCGTPTVSGGNVTVTVTVPAGQSATVTLTGSVSPTTTDGQLAMQGTVQPTDAVCSVAGVNCGGGSTNEVDPTVRPIPRFTQTKTANLETYLPGQAITYTITVSNTGAAAGTATVSDTVPPGVLGAIVNCAPVAPGTGSCAGLANTAGVIGATVTVPAGQSVAITLSGFVSATAAPGSLSNLATVTPTGADCTTAGVDCGGGPTNTVNPGIGSTPHFTQTKTADQSAYLPGQPITYTITVSNDGGVDGTATVSDTLPAGLLNPTTACAAVGPGTGSCANLAITAGVLGGTVTVPAGQSVAITVAGTVSPTATTGDLSNSATVTPTGPDCTTPGVDCGGGTTPPVNPPVTPIPHFGGVLSVDKQTVSPGDTITYTVTATNNGSAGGSVTIDLPLPPGLDGVSDGSVACTAADGSTATCGTPVVTQRADQGSGAPSPSDSGSSGSSSSGGGDNHDGDNHDGDGNDLQAQGLVVPAADGGSGGVSVLADLPVGQSVQLTMTGTVAPDAVTGDLDDVGNLAPAGAACATPGVDCGGGPTNGVGPVILQATTTPPPTGGTTTPPPSGSTTPPPTGGPTTSGAPSTLPTGPASGSSGPLAFTGADVRNVLILGIVLLLIGAAAAAATTRRRRTGGTHRH